MADELIRADLSEGGVLGLERHGDRVTEYRARRDGAGTEPAVSHFSGREHAVAAFMQKLLPALGECCQAQPLSPLPGVFFALYASSTLNNGSHLVIEINTIADVDRVWVLPRHDSAALLRSALVRRYWGTHSWQAFDLARRVGKEVGHAY